MYCETNHALHRNLQKLMLFFILRRTEPCLPLLPWRLLSVAQDREVGGFGFLPCYYTFSCVWGLGPDFSSSAVDTHSLCQRVHFEFVVVLAQGLVPLACFGLPLNGVWPWCKSSLTDLFPDPTC